MLRFTKPPAANHLTLDLDISEAELQDRPPTVNGLSERPTAEHLAQLPVDATVRRDTEVDAGEDRSRVAIDRS